MIRKFIDDFKPNVTTGFTAGCWDLFHHGHREMIQKSYQCSGRLTVGIMTDEYIKKVKGQDRPIDDISTRVQNVTDAFPKINIVFLNTKEDIVNYAKKHDIFFVGEDQCHLHNQHPHTMILPRTQGVSTTSLVSLNNG